MSTQLVDIYEPELQRRFLEDFGRELFKESIIGQEPSTTLGLDPVSRSTPKTYWLHNKMYIGVLFTQKIATKPWIKYQATIQHHRRIFVATLLLTNLKSVAGYQSFVLVCW